MAGYKVSVARSARKSLQSIEQRFSLRIIGVLESLESNPRPPGCAKLQGATRLWRIRVGDYRAIYEIDDAAQTVDVLVVRHRRDVYRL